MKYLLILLLFISSLSCDDHAAPNGMTYLIELPNSNVIETTNYRINNNNKDNDWITLNYMVNDADKLKITVVPYDINLLYNLGYKQGQIDAIEKHPCYAKILTDDGEVLWKDTCLIKRKPKI